MTTCIICLDKYHLNDRLTCDECKIQICLQCYSKVDKCPFCRKKYDMTHSEKCQYHLNKVKAKCNELQRLIQHTRNLLNVQ